MGDRATFTVQVEHRDDRVVVVPHGEIDLATAPVLEAALRRLTSAPRTPVAIDMSDIDFLACRGVDVISCARATMADAGLPLVVTGAEGSVRRVLNLCDAAERPGSSSSAA